MRRLLGVLAFFLLLAALGAAGWRAWQLQQRQQQLDARLAATQAHLTEKEQSFTMIEQERQKLSEAYDTLRERWSTSDEELQKLKQATGRMTLELTGVTQERADLAQRFEVAQSQTKAIKEQIEVLERQFLEVEASKATLEVQLKDVAAASLSPAEVEQLGLALARQQEEEQRLKEQLADLSRAYEAVAQQGPGQAAAPPVPAVRPAPAAKAPPASAADAIAEADVAQELDERQRLADRYRELGTTYLASHRYPEAVQAFEESLRYLDDPTVHTRLAFIYGRLLSNPEKSAYHLAQSPHGVDPATSTLRSASEGSGVPRSHRKLFWDWLVK